MKILIIGSPEEAHRILPPASREGMEVFHCPDWASARALLEARPEAADWVLAPRPAVAPGPGCAEPPVPGVLFSADSLARGGGCRIDWNESGTLELHCCMHDLARQGRAGAAGKLAQATAPVSFEFQRPCRKEGR